MSEIEEIRRILAGVGVTLEEASKNFDANMKALHRMAAPEPPLIQGYTAEQWQEIIDGGYLCEFSQNSGKWHINKLHDHREGTTHNFCMAELSTDITTCFKYCRPAQIKGVMRPIFVEPVGDPYCVFFDIDGKALHTGMMRFNFRKENPGYAGDTARATSYIEL